MSDIQIKLKLTMVQTRGLWKTLTDAISSIPKPDSSFLADVQDLLLAGFQSRDISIVNDTIMMWNETFAKAEFLEYPLKLQGLLSQLKCRVSIGLPGFVDDAEKEVSNGLTKLLALVSKDAC